MPDQLPNPPKSSAAFNIQELARNLHDAVFPLTPEQEAQRSQEKYRQSYGPTFSPPVSSDLKGFGNKQVDDRGIPYYKPPGQ